MEDHRYLEGMRNGILMLEEQLTKKGSKLDKQTARKAVRRLWDNFRTEFHNLGGEPLGPIEEEIAANTRALEPSPHHVGDLATTISARR
jgi:hypothetical protein